MLNGVGGRTISEAKQAVSYPEYLKWCAFRKKRGKLNLGMRMEEGFALLATIYANTHSKNGGYTLHDFSPHSDEPVIDLETAMETWK